MKKIQEMFKESIKGSTGKVDHKRLTVLAFTILFFVITGVALFKPTPITNQPIIEYVLLTSGSIILGGMGLSKIDFRKKKEENTNADQ